MNKIKKRDFLLGIGTVLLVLILILFMTLRGEKKGDYVRIQIAGEDYGVYSLYEDKEIVIEEEAGKNIVKIQGGKVRMLFADCPDQYCVKHAPIDNGYEPIVCLPHKVVVEIVDKK